MPRCGQSFEEKAVNPRPGQTWRWSRNVFICLGLATVIMFCVTRLSWGSRKYLWTSFEKTIFNPFIAQSKCEQITAEFAVKLSKQHISIILPPRTGRQALLYPAQSSNNKIKQLLTVIKSGWTKEVLGKSSYCFFMSKDWVYTSSTNSRCRTLKAVKPLVSFSVKFVIQTWAYLVSNQ